MIMLISPSQRGPECASAIELATGQPAQAVKSFHEAAALLRAQSYNAIIIDECLLDAEPDQGSLVLQHVANAIPIYVNCAVTGTDRLVDKVKKALHRRARDEAAARKAALSALACEFREPLTGIILNCELAVSAPNLPMEIKEKIGAVANLARELSTKLQSDQHSEVVQN